MYYHNNKILWTVFWGKKCTCWNFKTNELGLSVVDIVLINKLSWWKCQFSFKIETWSWESRWKHTQAVQARPINLIWYTMVIRPKSRVLAKPLRPFQPWTNLVVTEYLNDKVYFSESKLLALQTYVELRFRKVSYMGPSILGQSN